MSKQLEFLKLYAMNRNKHLKLPQSGGFYYFDVTKGRPKLTDDMLKDHLNQKYSIGVIPFMEKSSIVGIDIDYKVKPIVWKEIVEVAMKSIEILCSLGINKNSLIVSKSGMKGIHVDFLFDRMQQKDHIKRVLTYIVEELELTESFGIDKRGCNQSGYKLPLGLHFKTGTLCEILDVETFIPIENFEQWYDKHTLVYPEQWDKVLNNIPKVKVKYRNEHSTNSLNKGSTLIDLESLIPHKVTSTIKDVEDVILNGALLKRGSRNNMMWKISIFCRINNFSEEETYTFGKALLENTPDEFFTSETDMKWKLQQWEKEIYETYFHKKIFYQITREINISVEVLKEVLNLGRFNLMKLAFLHYLISELNTGYYLGRNKVEQLIGMKKDTVYSNTLELIGQGWIEVVEKGNNIGGIDIASTYKFLKKFPQDSNITVKYLNVSEKDTMYLV